MDLVMILIGLLLNSALALAADPLPKPMTSGLVNPASVAVGLDGRIYISEVGEAGKDGDGRVVIVDKAGKVTPFAIGLDDPQGMVFWQNELYVTDKQRVRRVNRKGKAVVFAAKTAFPTEPRSLKGIAVDESGVLYVSDSGDRNGQGGSVYRIDRSGKVSVVTDARRISSMRMPTGIVLDGLSHLLLLDAATGELLRVRIADGSAVKILGGFEGGDGLAWDWSGQLFITSLKQGKVWGIARPGQEPVLIAAGFEAASGLCQGPTEAAMLILDLKAGTLTALPSTIPGHEVDARPLPLRGVPAFPELTWTGWEASTEAGKINILRPIFLTHAGDGSQRNFVIIQPGTIHVFPNDPKAARTKLFLDIQHKVFYSDNENEQGLLGLAFHPNYKNNGEFFVFYSLREPKLTNVLSRFRVSREDPDKADPKSEEELFRISRPFWNHDGGTICFGPDGYLYVVVGDGGAADDPHKNGQNLKTFLGKILRIDVDRRDTGKGYGIPKDNPFVGSHGVAPEIWAYGVRNPWRIAFDRKTGWLWAGDVGQNLYEEIDLIVKGGNYGWSIREGLHPFSVNGVGPRKGLIEPIWEYHHDIGKSITGGLMYRGKRLPELAGHYVYGDYISGRIWALKYDEAKQRVVANRPLVRTNVPIFSFGEDERGEVYYLGPTVSGQGIFRFEAAAPKAN